ncbi:hypothetical protein PC129_g272 [Phytophthora cactorum]|uniref:NAD(P)-binding domain n=1 Tax=Phytophthora cactorum TaxID=29920 RepID=A0A8T1IYT4_9STRA|nr:hypothetical protein PC111_g75 [Phytophthora cactorum]KAG2849457.1 hypothetical protein PC112_g323 [Phytophthora cactorum]KAG2869451.1 hypothetical protein PC113_g179 [Phytophthora cactorum]KAG2944442.1 hypothetical protein PC115_g280 [Phytophthora cactorum]KAG3000723.1 hypothetical protein PC118_g66 [Phytophthora cactorum]
MVAPSKHALVVGASSGIGLAVAKELAPIVAKLTLCSRSYPEELLKTIQADNPNLEVVHEKLDVSLMHEVRKFTTKHADTQFDWIVMSPGIMTLNGRTETSEGLDVKMATHYYGRFMLIRDLLGRLICPGVRVLNVLGGGQGGYVDVDDLYLKRTYSLRRCAQATMQYSDLMAQSFSERAPKASFLHASPGFVSTTMYIVSVLLNDDYATDWKLLDQDCVCDPVLDRRAQGRGLEAHTQDDHDILKQ